jgi:hypothetical protein
VNRASVGDGRMADVESPSEESNTATEASAVTEDNAGKTHTEEEDPKTEEEDPKPEADRHQPTAAEASETAEKKEAADDGISQSATSSEEKSDSAAGDAKEEPKPSDEDESSPAKRPAETEENEPESEAEVTLKDYSKAPDPEQTVTDSKKDTSDASQKQPQADKAEEIKDSENKSVGGADVVDRPDTSVKEVEDPRETSPRVEEAVESVEVKGDDVIASVTKSEEKVEEHKPPEKAVTPTSKKDVQQAEKESPKAAGAEKQEEKEEPALPTSPEILSDQSLSDDQKFDRFAQLIAKGKMSNKEVVNVVLHLVSPTKHHCRCLLIVILFRRKCDTLIDSFLGSRSEGGAFKNLGRKRVKTGSAFPKDLCFD